jgi:hypothetical protein
MKSIGQTFSEELAQVNLTGLPFAWGEDGTFSFNENMTKDQIDAVLAVYEAHDPTKQVTPTIINPIVKLNNFLANNPDVANLLK